MGVDGSNLLILWPTSGSSAGGEKSSERGMIFYWVANSILTTKS